MQTRIFKKSTPMIAHKIFLLGSWGEIRRYHQGIQRKTEKYHNEAHSMCKNEASATGFEPARAWPNNLANCPLNHSGTLTLLC